MTRHQQVVNDLLIYKECKQRLKTIIEELDVKIEDKMGIDYNKPHVQYNSLPDPTYETVFNRLSSNLYSEYKVKWKLVRRVDVAFEGLDPVEKVLIKKKYLTGREVYDWEVYNDPEFGLGKTKYYEIKFNALAKLSRIMGYK